MSAEYSNFGNTNLGNTLLTDRPEESVPLAIDSFVCTNMDSILHLKRISGSSIHDCISSCSRAVKDKKPTLGACDDVYRNSGLLGSIL